ncbi:unnamed protein product, partial [Amoebophrya sp. A120]
RGPAPRDTVRRLGPGFWCRPGCMWRMEEKFDGYMWRMEDSRLCKVGRRSFDLSTWLLDSLGRLLMGCLRPCARAPGHAPPAHPVALPAARPPRGSE